MSVVFGVFVFYGFGLFIGIMVGGRFVDVLLFYTLFISIIGLVILLVLFVVVIFMLVVAVVVIVLFGGFGFAVNFVLNARVFSLVGEVLMLVIVTNFFCVQRRHYCWVVVGWFGDRCWCGLFCTRLDCCCYWVRGFCDGFVRGLFFGQFIGFCGSRCDGSKSACRLNMYLFSSYVSAHNPMLISISQFAIL